MIHTKIYQVWSNAYLGPCLISMLQFFRKKKTFNFSLFLEKRSVTDISRSLEYASAEKETYFIKQRRI